MRASAVNRQYLGHNTLRDLDAEYAAGGAANQSHAPRAARVRVVLSDPEGFLTRQGPENYNPRILANYRVKTSYKHLVAFRRCSGM
jgi:hypothetical protein